MFRLSDVWERSGLDPADLNVILHSPKGELASFLPAILPERPRLLEMYQATHAPPAAAALKQGRAFSAVFLKTGRGDAPKSSRLIFVGVYENRGYAPTTWSELRADEDVTFLHEAYQVSFVDKPERPDAEVEMFDLSLTAMLSDLRGRLEIEAVLTPTYVRRADNFDAPVSAIHALSMADAPAPDWREMILTAARLKNLPRTWAAALRNWAGIYLITDHDGARYVGSASGAENLLGRWRQHVAKEAEGVTAELRKRPTSRFTFSILELVSPTAPRGEVEALEASWKRRLHTRTHGLNDN